MELVEKLLAIEEIKQLKARYFRSVDTKDRAGLSRIFSEDAVFDMGGGSKVNPGPGETRVVTGGAAIVDILLTSLDKRMVSVHQGFCHEIEILSPDEARGIIGMEDRVVMMEDGKSRLRLAWLGPLSRELSKDRGRGVENPAFQGYPAPS
jgi:hypothetical protein